MAEGTVRWFDDVQGYGFITPDGGSRDLRVDASEVQTNGYKTLEVGWRVSFDVTYGGQGPQATFVTPLGEYASDVTPAAQASPESPPGTWAGYLVGLLALAALVALIAFVAVEVLGG
ncbi:cold shock domain-containing protein [Nocardiopsis endophytica]